MINDCFKRAAIKKINKLATSQVDLEAIMLEEYEKKRKKQVSFMRSFFDYGIGALIVLVGVFLLIRDRLDLAVNARYVPDVMDKVFGGICVLYGSWRIYRGYKKNYFK